MRPRRWPLAAAFLAGLAVTALALAPALYPAETYGLWCRLRYGAEPSPGGVILSLRPAPPGTAGEGAGPWVVAELHNVGGEATYAHVAERAGDELGFEAIERTADGGERAVARRALPPESAASPLHRVELGPGERLGLVVDLSRWLELPAGGPRGALRVRAERVPVAGDPHRCRSNWLWLPPRG